ncbi:hypothetical protein REPUB_Repub04eG0245300 [Reevesia pubescens]
MVIKLLTFFQKQVSVSLTKRKPYVQWRCLTYSIDYPFEYPSMDHTLASVHSISSNPCFALLGFCKNIDSLKKVHALFIINGFKDDLLCDTKLACSELRDINEGRKVHCLIVKVGNPDSFVQTGLVDMYAKCGEIECSRKKCGVLDFNDCRVCTK